MIASRRRAGEPASGESMDPGSEPPGLRAGLAAHLAAGLAHDVRNPLNAMAIHLEVLADKLREDGGSVPPAMERNLSAARSQIGRIDEIVRRYSDFSAGRPPATAELGELLAQAAALCDHEVRRHGGGLAVESPDGLRTGVPAAQLVLLLVTLLLAWGRALSRGGRLVVRALAGDVLTIRAEAEGVSVAPDAGPAGAAALARELGVDLQEDNGFVLRLPAA